MATVATGVPTAIGVHAAAQAHKVFYLNALKHHCYIAKSDTSQHFTAVRCSNPKHDLEVYWTGHGGWGRSNPSTATQLSEARATCISQYDKIDNGRHKAYSFFLADPGAQHRKYHDHVVCAHSTSPKIGRRV